jgi:hypothetical protein
LVLQIWHKGKRLAGRIKKVPRKKKPGKVSAPKPAKTVPVLRANTNIVGIKELMDVMEVTEVHIGRFVKDGMPKLGRGRYDKVECLRWGFLWRGKIIKGREGNNPDGSATGLSEERRQSIITKRKLDEIELRKKLAELVPVDMVENLFADLVMVFKGHLISSPARLAGMLVGLNQRDAAEVIRKWAREVLMAVGKAADNHEHLRFDTRAVGTDSDSAPEVVQPSTATTGRDGERVGRDVPLHSEGTQPATGAVEIGGVSGGHDERDTAPGSSGSGGDEQHAGWKKRDDE